MRHRPPASRQQGSDPGCHGDGNGIVSDSTEIQAAPIEAPAAVIDHSTTGAELVKELTPEELAAERAEHARRAQGPSFADVGVRPETVAALASVGITHAFAIQEPARARARPSASAFL
jgi:hypothetical protein